MVVRLTLVVVGGPCNLRGRESMQRGWRLRRVLPEVLNGVAQHCYRCLGIDTEFVATVLVRRGRRSRSSRKQAAREGGQAVGQMK